MSEMKTYFVVCPECISIRHVKSLRNNVNMKNFCITVTQIAKEPERIEDQIGRPDGIYYFSAESRSVALDDFHMSVPLACLDDFRIEIQEIDAGKALEFFKMYLEHNKKRCGALYFKLPEDQPVR